MNFKKLSFFLFFIGVIICNTFGQNKIDVFRLNPSRVIHRDFVMVGEIKGLKIQVVHHTDLRTQEKITGVRFDCIQYRSYGQYCLTASLDQDEFESVLFTLNSLLEHYFTTNPDSYEDVIFKTINSFEIGGYFSNGYWEGFVYFSSKYTYFKNIEFLKLRDMLLRAKELL